MEGRKERRQEIVIEGRMEGRKEGKKEMMDRRKGRRLAFLSSIKHPMLVRLVALGEGCPRPCVSFLGPHDAPP